MLKRIIVFIWFISTSWLMAADRPPVVSLPKPNIIFVLCDDLGAGDIGVLWQNGREGKQKFSTPNLDQFAKEGMILSRHYAPAPICASSRGSLLTGRHQGHCAVRNTQFDKELPNEHTIGSVLQKAGYATAAIGKWGLQGGPYKLSIPPVRGDRSPETEPSHPLLRGFDYFYGYTSHRDAHYHYPHLGNRPLYDGFVDVTDRLAKSYSTDLITARTKKWIVDHQKANPQQPFFTYLCYTAPHAGMRIPTTSHLTKNSNYPKGGGLSGGLQWNEDASNGQINTAKGTIDNGIHPEVADAMGDDGKPWPDQAKRHATMVRRIDDAMADLVHLLKDLEIDDNTLIVFTSDNGTPGESGLDDVGTHAPDYLDTFGRYDGSKRDMWEGGVRMPTFVRWPSAVAARSESDAASQFHDWMATFCDLAGVPAPAVSDGVSIVPTLTGQGKQAQGVVYSEIMIGAKTLDLVEFEASRRGRPHGQMQTILIGDYKGVRVDIKDHQSVFEVYHTLNDPKEATDLAGKPGVPTQKDFQAAVLRSRRIDPEAERPYDKALIPALVFRKTRIGLNRKEYPGDFNWVPQLEQLKPSSQKLVSGLETAPGAQQFAGYLRVPKDGVYHFALTTQGKAVVRLHDALLIDADSQYIAGANALSGEIALQAGLHPLRINYLETAAAKGLSLKWQVPGAKMVPIPNTHYRAAIPNNASTAAGGFDAASGFDMAEKVASTFSIPEDLTIEVFAAKPQLVNPVTIALDEQGRVYVAEEHRFFEGVAENRRHDFMLEDDLQITTIEDRLAMQKKWAHKFDNGSDWFTQSSDIVLQLEDTDGDGRADASRVFADGFDGPLDGLGAGLIARDGKVWYTCIPNLWLLEDKNGDGKAENKEALLTGFGVNAGFYGHDMHGLTWGIDGKLYFSVGDRGAHVETKEGTTISNPRRGAVYRCNPDGTELERIHQGLRNPQELAFDQYGNLFTDDNNSDKGDHSRLVYVVPGGDSGWKMEYQTMAEPYLTGPWHAEGMWHLEHDLQPAFIVPPVGEIGAGPSGFVFSSGTSLPSRYRNHFFYCNYKPGIGGVESFAVKQQGAGFTISDHHDFCKPIKASDVDFGYDGKMYVSTYPTRAPERYNTGGRIYTIFDKTRLSEPKVAETSTLFQEGFRHRTVEALASLLHHDDMRVRLRAQFALAERGNASAEALTGIATRDENQLARLHAIWGLGQIGRTDPKAMAPVLALLKDEDSEVRAQSARVLGDAHYESAAGAIVNLLADDAPRVRFFAALALGSLQTENVGERIISMLRENDGEDRYLTHAGVVALEQIGDRDFVQQWAGDKSPAVRMAVLLVQRRWSDPRIAQFLDDTQLKIVTEAARAINDLPLTTGRDKLANLAERFKNASGENVVPLMRRIINANRMIGDAAAASRLISLAVDGPDKTVRGLSLEALESWEETVNRDPVNGEWRPIAPADSSGAKGAMMDVASKLLEADRQDHWASAIRVSAAFKVTLPDDALERILMDLAAPLAAREAAFNQLASQASGRAAEIGADLLASPKQNIQLAEAILSFLASSDPQGAIPVSSRLALDDAISIPVRQSSINALTARESLAAHDALRPIFKLWRAGKVPPGLLLELHKAAAVYKETAPAKDDAALRFLHGGDASRGRNLFVNHPVAQCIRCHRIGGRGGDAGPNLDLVAERLSGPQLVEALVNPGARIAPGFGVVSVTRHDGTTVAGVLRAETDGYVEIAVGEEPPVRVNVADIASRARPLSSMPPMSAILKPHEIRDLVAYLATTARAGK